MTLLRAEIWGLWEKRQVIHFIAICNPKSGPNCFKNCQGFSCHFLNIHYFDMKFGTFINFNMLNLDMSMKSLSGSFTRTYLHKISINLHTLLKLSWLAYIIHKETMQTGMLLHILNANMLIKGYLARKLFCGVSICINLHINEVIMTVQYGLGNS